MGETIGITRSIETQEQQSDPPRMLARRRTTESSASSPVQRDQQRASVRVVCVDDHVVLIEGLKAQFAADGQVRCVASLTSAEGVIDTVAEHRPDVVLLDIEMPGPDVFEVADRLHHLHPETRFVFLSAHIRDGFLASAYRCGASGYFAKGDDLDEIVDGLKRIARCAKGTFILGTKVRARCQPPKTRKQEAEHAQAETAHADVDLAALDRIGETCWADLRGKRVYFAHEELGGEIVKGVETVLARKAEIGLQVLSFRAQEREAHRREQRGAREAGAFDRPGVFHATIGHDGEPEDKIDAFEEFLLSTEGEKVDVAILKLSCADIGRSTDVAKVLDRYAGAVESVRKARPALEVIHCTAPLREADHGAKAAMKKMVGMGTDAANANRGRYNDLLRKRFDGEVVLDVAGAESRRLDGTAETVTVKGERWPALAAEFGKGGHGLTEAGRVTLGREFLLALAHCCGEAKGKKPEVTAAPTGGAESVD
jgi:DNA-binding NarL/FixJ family response regulator